MNHPPAYREFHSVSPPPYAEVHSLERWSRELTRRLLCRKSVRIRRLINKNSKPDNRDYNLGQLRVRGLFQYGKSGTSNHPRSPIRQHLAQHVEKKRFIVNDKDYRHAPSAWATLLITRPPGATGSGALGSKHQSGMGQFRPPSCRQVPVIGMSRYSISTLPVRHPRFSSVRCLLIAHSGHPAMSARMSAFRGEASYGCSRSIIHARSRSRREPRPLRRGPAFLGGGS